MAPNISSRPTGPVNVPESAQELKPNTSKDKLERQDTDKLSDSKNNVDSSLEITDSKQAKQRRNTLGQAEKRPTDSHQALAVSMPERRITDQIPGKALKEKAPEVDMSTAAISSRLAEGLEKDSPLNALTQAFNADAKTVESQANEVFFPILRHIKTSQPDLPPAEIKGLARQHIDSMLKDICADVFKDKDSIDTFVETLKDDKDFIMKNSKSPLRALMGTYMDKLESDGLLSQSKKGKDALATENEKALASWANAAPGETGNAFSASQNHIFSEAVLMAHQAAKGTFDADKAGFAALSIEPPAAPAEPSVAKDKTPDIPAMIDLPPVDEDKASEIPAMIDLPPVDEKSPGDILDGFYQNLSPDRQAKDAELGDPNAMNASAQEAQHAHQGLLPSTSVARAQLESHGVQTQTLWPHKLQIKPEAQSPLGQFALQAQAAGVDVLFDPDAKDISAGRTILLSADALNSGAPGAVEKAALADLVASTSATQNEEILKGTEKWEPTRMQQSVGLISGKEISDLDNASPAELLAILRDEPPALPSDLTTTMTHVQEGLTSFGLDRAQVGQAVNAQDFNAAQTLIDTLEEITPGGFRGSMRMALLNDMPALNNYLDGAMDTLGRELPAASDATYQREVLSLAQDYQAHLIKEGALNQNDMGEEFGKLGPATLEAHQVFQSKQG